MGADMTTAKLWAADPHQFGPGKVHIVDAESTDKTMCGKWLIAIPGKHPNSGRATCKICLNAVENRAHYKVLQEQRAQELERHNEERAAADREWWDRYNAYLKSPAWWRKRERVMRRAGNVCEGCGINSATQVHHLTYAHVCEEFLWELRAVCDVCHARLHETDRARRAG